MHSASIKMREYNFRIHIYIFVTFYIHFEFYLFFYLCILTASLLAGITGYVLMLFMH